jgi:UDP-glucose 4-epimerase
VIEAARRVTGVDIPVVEAARRPGDPALLVASSENIRRELGWARQYADVESIIGSTWEWMQKNPEGYASEAVEAIQSEGASPPLTSYWR